MCRVGWHLVPLFLGPNPGFQLSALGNLTISDEVCSFISLLTKGDENMVSGYQDLGGISVPASHVILSSPAM